MNGSDQKIPESGFVGSLTVLAVLIAVVGLVGEAKDKVIGISYLWPKFQVLQYCCAGLAVFSAILAILCLEKMRGAAVSLGLIVWFLRLLIVGTAAVTVGFVAIW